MLPQSTLALVRAPSVTVMVFPAGVARRMPEERRYVAGGREQPVTVVAVVDDVIIHQRLPTCGVGHQLVKALAPDRGLVVGEGLLGGAGDVAPAQPSSRSVSSPRLIAELNTFGRGLCDIAAGRVAMAAGDPGAPLAGNRARLGPKTPAGW